jgi:FkbM family methyltransferase
MENFVSELEEMPIVFYSSTYKQKIYGYNDYILNWVAHHEKRWEETLCELIVDNIEDGTDFIDIGANIGLITLGVNQISLEKGKNINSIHCFECDQNTFKILMNNTETLQNKDSIKLYPFALSDKFQLCLMSGNSYNRGCNFIYNTIDCNSSSNYNYPFIPKTNHFEKRIFVPSFCLDELQYQFQKVGALKIDVEGFEYFVLLGARNIIMTHKPIILIEIWDVNKDKIVELMKNDFNYTVEFIQDQNYICRPIPTTS